MKKSSLSKIKKRSLGKIKNHHQLNSVATVSQVWLLHGHPCSLLVDRKLDLCHLPQPCSRQTGDHFFCHRNEKIARKYFSRSFASDVSSCEMFWDRISAGTTPTLPRILQAGWPSRFLCFYISLSVSETWTSCRRESGRNWECWLFTREHFSSPWLSPLLMAGISH